VKRIFRLVLLSSMMTTRCEDTSEPRDYHFIAECILAIGRVHTGLWEAAKSRQLLGVESHIANYGGGAGRAYATGGSHRSHKGYIRRRRFSRKILIAIGGRKRPDIRPIAATSAP
jgi:hypothetical protein